MSPELRKYLNLEQAMVELDARGNPESDQIRDVMDIVWNQLSTIERDWINGRVLPPLASELRVPIGDTLFVAKPIRKPDPNARWVFDDWRGSAA
jgi:hypothetical protein